MIQALGEYVVSLSASALLGGILVSLFPEGTVRSLLELCCAMVLTITALSPLPGLEIPDLTAFAKEYTREGESLAVQGAMQAEEERLQCINQALEAYILDKANSLGITIRPELTLLPDGSPDAVVVCGSWTERGRQTLSAIITNDLGIPEEDQQWNAMNGLSESEKQSENTAGPP